MSDFSRIAEFIMSWPEGELPEAPMEISCNERLRKTLLKLCSGDGYVGEGDIAGLVGHFLSREECLKKNNLVLRVPKDPRWPTKERWLLSSMDVINSDEKSYYLKARSWCPSWLEESDKVLPLEEVFSEKKRRQEVPVIADPCMKAELGDKFSRYISQGQQMAVRSAFFCKKGSTIIINLPTGSGKSLAAWAPAIFSSAEPILTLVVVPTIALAIDQESQFKEIARKKNLTGPFAWHSGIPEEDRALIKQRMRNGDQKILFASPESALGTLCFALYEATQRGYLKYFIIDEAHLIAQWGNEFRPEFQALSGLRNDLLKICPANSKFRTLLMTATLTQDSFDTIKTLFGQETTLEVVSAINLRPEPSYWICHALTEEDRTDKIRDAIRNFPRPLLLYVSTRDDVGKWSQLLKEERMLRFDAVHGATDPMKRCSIISNWRNGDIDIVVATSAFGLGVDKSDVRSVIHACVPETIDRFYQEVGRGGRDGRACISLLVYTDHDKEIAKSLGQERIITIDRGLERWKAMFLSSEKANGKIRVSLNSKPPGVIADSEANSAWNLRTLLLMSRSGLISLESEAPPKFEKSIFESEEAFENAINKELEKYFSTWIVNPAPSLDHTNYDVWQKHAEPIRKKTAAADKANFELMNEVLSKQCELSDVLCKIYTVETELEKMVPVAACGGCHMCRKKNHGCGTYSIPRARPIQHVENEVSSRVLSIVDSFKIPRQFVAIAYERPKSSEREIKKWQKKMLLFLFQMVSLGFAEVATNVSWLMQKDYVNLYLRLQGKFIIHQNLHKTESNENSLPLPRISIIGPEDFMEPIPQYLFFISRPIHLVIAPSNVPDNFHPIRKYFDIGCHIPFNDFFSRIIE